MFRNLLPFRILIRLRVKTGMWIVRKGKVRREDRGKGGKKRWRKRKIGKV